MNYGYGSMSAFLDFFTSSINLATTVAFSRVEAGFFKKITIKHILYYKLNNVSTFKLIAFLCIEIEFIKLDFYV